jgi:hypothetical protein
VFLASPPHAHAMRHSTGAALTPSVLQSRLPAERWKALGLHSGMTRQQLITEMNGMLLPINIYEKKDPPCSPNLLMESAKGPWKRLVSFERQQRRRTTNCGQNPCHTPKPHNCTVHNTKPTQNHTTAIYFSS